MLCMLSIPFICFMSGDVPVELLVPCCIFDGVLLADKLSEFVGSAMTDAVMKLDAIVKPDAVMKQSVTIRVFFNIVLFIIFS